MKKGTVLFCSAVLLIGIIMACQKQQVATQTKTTASKEAARVNLSINQPTDECRITIEKAKLFMERFRTQEEAKPGTKVDYVVGYTIPAVGVLDILKEAENQSIKLTHIYAYKGINDAGKETLIYGGMDEMGKGIFWTPKTTANWHQTVLEDIVESITNNNTHIKIVDILNSQKQWDNVQNPTAQKEAARLNLSINQPTDECRITTEKAKLFMDRFRTQEEAKLGTKDDYVVGYKIPAMGILDILREAEGQGIKLTYIYTYKGINDAGKETLIYGGIDANNEILYWPKEVVANWHQPALEDVAGDITNNDIRISNILNDK